MTSSPSPSAIDKMHAGEWYNCRDASLDPLRHSARVAVHHHNTAPVSERGAIGAKLAALLGCCPASTMIEAPFHCAYGINIYLGENVYFNAGCTILDTGRVTIGANSMFGPAVQIYCADHHRDPNLRAQGLERALPVTIGADVWVGGGAIILPGITIGNGAIIGAGAVVTRNVPQNATAVGNPAR